MVFNNAGRDKTNENIKINTMKATTPLKLTHDTNPNGAEMTNAKKPNAEILLCISLNARLKFPQNELTFSAPQPRQTEASSLTSVLQKGHSGITPPLIYVSKIERLLI